jgi:hypothetical protein
MQIIITPDGAARCIYTEEINLAAIGSPTISRASHVEPDQHGRWLADMSPVGGGVLGPYELRSEALMAEQAWLEAHWLARSNTAPPEHCHQVGPSRRQQEE